FAYGDHLMGGIEPNPRLFLGVSYRAIRGLGYNRFSVRTYTDFVSAAVELHPEGEFWADPYVSADLGYSSYTFDNEDNGSEHHGGLALALGAGFAFRSKYVSLGPQMTFVGGPVTDSWSVMIDLRLDVRF